METAAQSRLPQAGHSGVSGLALQPYPHPGRARPPVLIIPAAGQASLQAAPPEPSPGAKPLVKSAWLRSTPRAPARDLQGKDQPLVLPLVGVTFSVFTHSFPRVAPPVLP